MMKDVVCARMKAFLVLGLLLATVMEHGVAQVLEFGSLEEGWTVCANRMVSMTVTNTSGDDLENTSVTLHLPCGVEYVQGTFQGGAELDLSDLNKPVLGLSNIEPGMQVSLNINVIVTCAAIPCLNSGQVFSIHADLSSSAGTQTFVSDPFNLETPQLVVTAIDQPYIAAGKNETVTRTITVRNTRLGRLASFDLEDAYAKALLITSSDGANNGTVPQKLRRQFSSAHFQQIGNKDGYFDFNEEMKITEVIEVVSCAFEAQQALSNIRLSWGCGGSDCQVVELQALVDIQAKTEVGDPLRISEYSPNEPLCYNEGGQWQSMLIENIAELTDLKNVTVSIDPILLRRGVRTDSVFVVTSQNDTLDVQVSYGITPDTSCNNDRRTFKVVIPFLARKSSVKLTWLMSYCQLGGCNPPKSHWKWKYRYEKECAHAEVRFVNGEGVTGPIQEEIGSMHLEMMVPGVVPMQSGDTVFVKALLTSEYLLSNDGSVQVELTAPCGLLYSTTDYKLSGILPSSVSVVEEPISLHFILTYPLPLPASTGELIIPFILDCDSLCVDVGCKDTLITSCDIACKEPIAFMSFGARARFILDGGCLSHQQPMVCSRELLMVPIDCYSELCIDTLPGYYIHDLFIHRVSLGLADLDNDGEPDPGGVLDTSLIRLDRVMTSDSFLIEADGVIFMDKPDHTFTHAYYKLLPGNVGIEGGTASEKAKFIALSFGPDGLMRMLDRRVEIYDSSHDIWYHVDTFPIRFGIFSSQYYLDISLPVIRQFNSLIPADYTYSHGDSIRIRIRNRVDVNIVKGCGGTRMDIKYVGNMYFSSESVPLEYLFPEITPTCFCASADLEVYGLAQSFEGQSMTFPNYCPGEEYAFPSSYYKLACSSIEKNYFPNEVRSRHALSGIYARIESNEVDLNAYKLISDYIEFEDGPPFYVDITSFGQKLQAEEYKFPLAFRFKNRQCVKSDIWLEYHLEIDAHPALASIYKSPLVKGPIQIKTRYPVLVSNIQEENIQSVGDEVEWTMSLSNQRPGISQDTARNNWVTLHSPPGNLSNLNVYNSTTGQPYSQINGIWQLPDIPPDGSLQIAITATNTSCDREQLFVQYGWNCEPYTSLDQEPCIVYVDTLSVISAPGLLELQPDPDTISGPLCAPMPETKILFINADLGAVYALTATVDLPPGLHYVSGSATIIWPAGSGNSQAVTDPQVLVDGRLVWTLTDLIPGLADGLPGVNSTPDNGLELRFDTESDCDFIVGSRIITRFSGQQICGKPTNTSTKVSGPYSINGVSSPYTVSIAVNPVDSSLCEDLISVHLTLNTSEIVGNQDKLILELPPGFSYQAGSCQTNLTPSEPIQQNNQLIWILQEGLATTTLNLSLQISEEVLCETVIMPIYTTTETSAFCVEAGKYCSVAVITGSRYLPFQIDKPAYELTNLTPGWVNGQLVLTGDLLQTGGTISGIGSVQVVLDENQNGVFDAGDSLVGEYPFMFTNSDSLHLALSGIDLAPEDWCHLLVVIDANANCACTTTTATLDGPNLFPEFIQTPLCAGDSLVLGRSEKPGVTYQWLTKDLDCMDCAEQVLQWSDPGSNAKTQHYWLREYRGDGCTIELEFVVTMLPRPSFYQDSLAICLGDTATLLTSPGQQWTWTGPAQVGGGEQSLLVAPGVSSTYTVTITDDFGCVGVDTATVSVLALPIAAAGLDTSYCYGAEARLQAIQYPGVSYFWTNGYDRLSDVQKTDPLILLQEPFTYILEVDNGQCRSTDNVTISFYDGFDIAGLPDTFRACLGDMAVFNVQGAQAYQWQPYYTWLCNDPACSMVSIPVNGTSTYTVTAQNEMGCEDERSVVVFAEPEEIWMGDSLTICAGSSVEIFGEMVSEAGTYCDTTFFASGCREVTCLQLILESGPETNLLDTICLGEQVIFKGDTLTQSGEYCVTLSTVSGCDSLVCLSLLASPAPVIDWLVDEVVLCPEDSFKITPLITPPGSEYTWNDGYPSLSRSIVGVGTYTLNVTNACGQESVRSIHADLTPLPSVDVGLDSTICEDAEILVIPDISDGVVDWYWSDGSLDLERVFQDEGIYILTVADSCQQEALDSLQIQVERCIACPVEMPNVFSPNGDGVNDLFTFYTECEVNVLSLRVFNRWGGLVYDGRGPDAGWNGQVEAREAPMDVYVYILTIDDPVDGERVIRGDVTLVR